MKLNKLSLLATIILGAVSTSTVIANPGPAVQSTIDGDGATAAKNGSAFGFQAHADGEGGTAVGVQANAGKNSTAVGLQAEAKADNSTAVGTWAHAYAKGSVALGINSDTELKYTDTTAKYTKEKNKDASWGVVSIGSTNKKNIINRRLTNLAGGVDKTDAANIGQLDVVDDKVEKNIKDIKTMKGSVATSTKDINTMKGSVTTNTKDINTMKGSVTTNTKDINTMKDSVATNTKDINTMKGSVTTNTKDINTMKGSVATNTKDIKTVKTDVKNNAVNIATNTKEIKLLKTNIALLDTKRMDEIDRLAHSNRSRINALDKREQRHMAQLMAAAGLFQPYTVGQLYVTAAMGQYRSNTAVAVGTGYRFNEHFAVRTAVSMNTKKMEDAGYNIGMFYGF